MYLIMIRGIDRCLLKHRKGKTVVSRSATNPLYMPTSLPKLPQDTPTEPGNPNLAPQYEEIRESYTQLGVTSCKKVTAGNPRGNAVVYDTVCGDFL